MLWGFLNTLQIISYFQFTSLYFPLTLSAFLESLSIASFNINIGIVDEMVDNMKEYAIGNEDYDLYPDGDDQIQENGIDSLSIIRNASGIAMIMTQGI